MNPGALDYTVMSWAAWHEVDRLTNTIRRNEASKVSRRRRVHCGFFKGIGASGSKGRLMTSLPYTSNSFIPSPLVDKSPMPSIEAGGRINANVSSVALIREWHLRNWYHMHHRYCPEEAAMKTSRDKRFGMLSRLLILLLSTISVFWRLMR